MKVPRTDLTSPLMPDADTRRLTAIDNFLVGDLIGRGEGRIAYVLWFSPEKAKELFPSETYLPDRGRIYALMGANCIPIVFTDSRNAAKGYAIWDALEVVSVH